VFGLVPDEDECAEVLVRKNKTSILSLIVVGVAIFVFGKYDV
jgi:hypothetical protein